MANEASTMQPNYATPPGATLRDVLDALGMTQAELAERAGRPERTISQIVTGKRQITAETALEFERVLGTPADFWTRREASYRAGLVRLEERKRLLADEAPLARDFPYAAMAKLGWVEPTRDPVERAGNLLGFFGVASLKLLDDQPAAIYRVGTCREPSQCALMAWLRAGQLAAYGIDAGDFSAPALRECIPDLRAMTMAPRGELRARLRQMFAERGVAFVVVPHLPKTAAHGATHWLGSSKVVLQLSLRYRWADIFWFSLFHELGHVLLHGKREVYVNHTDREHEGPEAEADDFAAGTLIPEREYAAFIEARPIRGIAVREFAQEIGVHPGIVVGRLQHDRVIKRSDMNALRQQYRWED